MTHIASDSLSSQPQPSSYPNIIPDCLHLIFEYLIYDANIYQRRRRGSRRRRNHHHDPGANYDAKYPSLCQPYDTIPDAKFALQYIKCWYFGFEDVIRHLKPDILMPLSRKENYGNDSDSGFISSSRKTTLTTQPGITNRAPSGASSTINNITAASINYLHMHHISKEVLPLICGAKSLTLDSTDIHTPHLLPQFQNLHNLSIRWHLPDAAFSHMSHLTSLEMNKGRNLHLRNFSDEAFRYLYQAGSRLERLSVNGCKKMTDGAFRFLGGLRELHLSECPLITDDAFRMISGRLRVLSVSLCTSVTSGMFQYLKGIRSLSVQYMKAIEFEKHFEYLEASIEELDISDCTSGILVEKDSFRFLRGVSVLKLCFSILNDLTNDEFRHLTGGIKRLDITGLIAWKLTKDFMHHITGIQYLNLQNCDICIQEDDLIWLKAVFCHLRELRIRRKNVADEDTLDKLRDLVQERDGVILLY